MTSTHSYRMQLIQQYRDTPIECETELLLASLSPLLSCGKPPPSLGGRPYSRIIDLEHQWAMFSPYCTDILHNLYLQQPSSLGGWLSLFPYQYEALTWFLVQLDQSKIDDVDVISCTSILLENACYIILYTKNAEMKESKILLEKTQKKHFTSFLK